jgi:hypothetical protein
MRAVRMKKKKLIIVRHSKTNIKYFADIPKDMEKINKKKVKKMSKHIKHYTKKRDLYSDAEAEIKEDSALEESEESNENDS